ncbi:efflux RND transporter permease subunit [Thiohalocapsa marina]|uniref:efflux RND transporter permease subunit n=1 Tax=Thiohalocapsa marina TaxID=424902 RepID=UPI001FE637BD|nr:efflux RND transporter permease subunit [Thiohalocapsa marina]
MANSPRNPALRVLPVARFPDIVPPQVSVQAFYPGANAEIVAETVGVRLSDLFLTTLQSNLGALYVNDFNLFGLASKTRGRARIQLASTQPLGTDASWPLHTHH